MTSLATASTNVVVMDVTPKIAEEWINANKTNRHLRPGVVEKYASDMKNGRWTLCTQAISFYHDGDLADGQHRLFAIIESGTTQRFTIMRGLAREDGLNIDTQLPRNLVDNARISGIDPSLTTTIIVAVRAMEFGNASRQAASSNAELMAMVERHRDAANFANSYVRRVRLLCGGTVLGAVGRAYEAGVDQERLKRFCAVLGTGFYNQTDEIAAIALRNYLLTKGAVASTAPNWRDTFLKAQHAIAAFMNKKSLTVLRTVSDESYPLGKSASRKAKNRALARKLQQVISATI